MERVFVDVGGTLWPDRWPRLPTDRSERIQRLCRTVDLSRRHAAGLVDELAGLEHPVGPRQLTKDLVGQAIGRQRLTGVVGVADAIDAMCLPAAGRVEPFDGADELLSGLAARSLRVVVVSNVMWRDRSAQRRDFEAFGLARFVTDYVQSLDVGWRKPDRRFFDACVAQGHATGPESIMVGDSEVNDIQPASARGMLTVRVAIDQPTPASSEATYVCRSLAEVGDRLFRHLDH